MTRKILSPQDFSKGQPIFDAAEKAMFAYVVLDGKVEVTGGADAPKPQSIGKGEFFGEESLSNELVYHNSARALTDAKCIRISREILTEKLDVSDPFVKALFKIFSSHLTSIMKVGQAARAREEVARLAKDMELDTDMASDDDDSFMI